MRQFTIITKDGSKWLRPTTHPSKSVGGHNYEVQAGNLSDILYIGGRPIGTTLDESEVREVRQHKIGGKWHVTTSDLSDTGFSDYWELETRTAYTDAGSHDRHMTDGYPGIDYQPLFNHMSKEHGLTLTTGEMDEIIGLSTYILAKNDTPTRP